MKHNIKLIFSSALFLLAFNSFSQIQINESDLIIRGKYQMAVDTNGGYSLGTAGPNKTWDFSNLKAHSTSERLIKDYKGAVTDANLVEIVEGDSSYYQKNNSALTVIFPITDFGAAIYKKIKVFDFPIKFNNTNKDSTNFVTYASGDDFGFPQVDSIRISIKISISSIADAWGKIKIPLGNFDALRIKTITVTKGKFAAKTGKFPYIDIPGSEIDESSTDYQWLTNNKGTFLALYSEADDNMEFMTSSLGINKLTNVKS